MNGIYFHTTCMLSMLLLHVENVNESSVLQIGCQMVQFWQLTTFFWQLRISDGNWKISADRILIQVDAKGNQVLPQKYVKLHHFGSILPKFSRGRPPKPPLPQREGETPAMPSPRRATCCSATWTHGCQNLFWHLATTKKKISATLMIVCDIML